MIGVDKPVWLTETNAMPSHDTQVACPHSDAPIQATMDQQAAYAVQAFAMAASGRPIATPLQTAVTAFSG